MVVRWGMGWALLGCWVCGGDLKYTCGFADIHPIVGLYLAL